MRRYVVVSLLLTAVSLLSLNVAGAWDVSYEGDIMPNSPLLGSAVWGTDYYNGDLSASSIEDEALHLVDIWNDKNTYLSREGCTIPGGTSLTIEARVKVLSAAPSPDYPFSFSAVSFGASTWGGVDGYAFLGLWPDRITTKYGDGNNTWSYEVDLTQYHIFRIAMNPENRFWIWMDGDLLFSEVAISGYQDGIHFGGDAIPGNTSDSYWDYVRYSKDFIPVPESSSLLALASCLLPVGVAVMRRRRSVG